MRENLFDTINNEFPGAILLNEGGQKSVFKIIHPDYGESVIKIGNFDDGSTLERVRREVELLSKIDSPFFKTSSRSFSGTSRSAILKASLFMVTVSNSSMRNHNPLKQFCQFYR